MTMVSGNSSVGLPPEPSPYTVKGHRDIVQDQIAAMRTADRLGDAATEHEIGSNVMRELPDAGIPSTYNQRIGEIIANPDDRNLQAADAYMRDLNTPGSLLGPDTKPNYGDSQLAAMAGGDGTLGATSLPPAPSDDASGPMGISQGTPPPQASGGPQNQPSSGGPNSGAASPMTGS